MHIPLGSIFRDSDFPNKYVLYKILNTQNGNWYIGSTKAGLAKRIRSHRTSLRSGCHANQHLQNSYNLYGEESFVVIIVMESQTKILDEEEQKLIDQNFGQLYFYNVSSDTSSPMLGRKHSQESINKIRAASRKNAKKIGECTRKHRLGSKHSPETIKKMIRSALNRDNSRRIAVMRSDEVRKKMSKALSGRKMTKERYEKHVKTLQSDDYRKKMSKIKSGIPCTDTMRHKSSMTRIGRSVSLVNIKTGQREDVLSIRDFCKDKHKVNRHEISRLISGKRSEYNGWRLCS